MPDDFSGNSSTSGVISAGGSATGRIEVSYDHDWFRISLVAGGLYQFRLTPGSSGGLLDPYLYLYNSSGSLLSYNDDSEGTLNSLITFTAATSGTYYLDAAGYSSNIGQYVLSATQLASDDFAGNTGTSGSVSPGGSVSGRIESIGDHDWFRISLNAGSSYTIGLNATSLNDPYLRVYNSSGSLLAYNDDGGGNLNSLLTFTASSTGTYYLDAAAYGSGTGGYTLSVSGPSGSDDFANNSSTSGSVSVNGSATGRVEAVGDHDWFRVNLTAGHSYRFRLDSSASSGLNDPYLRLYNSSGTLITYNDDGGGNLNSLIAFSASTGGTYYLDAAAYGSGTGNYVLSVTSSGADDFAASTATTGTVSPGGSRSGTIETAYDHDWFAVSLTSGQTYEFQLNGNSLSDPYLRLYNSSGSLLTYDDDSGAGLNSFIRYTASSTGTYYLDAAAYSSGTGTYTVLVNSVGSPDDFTANTSTTGTITVGGNASGVVNTVGDHDWFRVSLTAGQTYQFRLDRTASNGLDDPYLRLFNASGTQLAFNDDSGGNLNSLLTYTATASGTYYLDAAAYSNGTGGYSLSARTTSAPQTPGSDTFNITVNYSGDATYQSAFTTAANRWAQIITAGLPDVFDGGVTIDDLAIAATVTAIDGAGGILGSAGPTAFRSSGGLPYRGIMRFDSADIASMHANGTLVGVILHEMGHVLGIGTLWTGLLNSSSDFTGASAVTQWRTLSSNPGATFVPVEHGGGAGTRNSHWSEAIFDTELMTGYVDQTMQISRVTIGSLADLGYTVNLNAADPYVLP